MKGSGILHFAVIVPAYLKVEGHASWEEAVQSAFDSLPERFAGEWTYVLAKAEHGSPDAPVHLQCARVGSLISASEDKGAGSYIDDGSVLVGTIQKLLKQECGVSVVPYKIQEKQS